MHKNLFLPRRAEECKLTIEKIRNPLQVYEVSYKDRIACSKKKFIT